MTVAMDILRWNTNRPYAADGQRMIAAFTPTGAVFYDITREIDGFVAGAATPAEIMAGYDTNIYADVPDDLRETLQTLKRIA
jgi:hypothetical protein